MCDVCDMWFHLKCAGLQKTSSRKEQLICKEYMQSGSSVHSVCVCSLLFSNVVFAENIVRNVCMLLLFSLVLYHLHLIILLLFH